MEFTKRERDCLLLLKVNGKMRLSRLSESLGVRPPTAYALVQKLINEGEIRKDGNNLLELTKPGMRSSGELLFKHRVLETLLVRNGCSADKACSECMRFDYILSNTLVKALYESLNKPKSCPHGKPIERVQVVV